MGEEAKQNKKIKFFIKKSYEGKDCNLCDGHFEINYEELKSFDISSNTEGS